MHRNGQLDAADAAYRDILADEVSADHVSTDEEVADAAYLLAVLRHQRGDDDEAETLLRRAIALDGNMARYHLALGGVQMHRDEESAALASFQRALELDPNSIEAHGVLGHLTLLAGDAAARKTAFASAVAPKKTIRRSCSDSAMFTSNAAKPTNAAKFLARAAEQRPDDAAIQFSLGRALFEQGAYNIAEKALQNALKQRPDLSLAKLFLARAYMRQDKLDEAQALFSELAAGGQQPFGANAGLGDIARRRQQAVRASKYYRRALAIDPTHPGAIIACAWCMEFMKDHAAAERYLTEGLKHATDPQMVRVELAKLLDGLGRAEDAAQGPRRMNAQSEIDVDAELTTRGAPAATRTRAHEVAADLRTRRSAYRPKAFIGRLYYARALEILDRRYEATVNVLPRHQRRATTRPLAESRDDGCRRCSIWSSTP